MGGILKYIGCCLIDWYLLCFGCWIGCGVCVDGGCIEILIVGYLVFFFCVVGLSLGEGFVVVMDKKNFCCWVGGMVVRWVFVEWRRD